LKESCFQAGNGKLEAAFEKSVHKGQEPQVPGTLDGNSQFLLVLQASAGEISRLDL